MDERKRTIQIDVVVLTDVSVDGWTMVWGEREFDKALATSRTRTGDRLFDLGLPSTKRGAISCSALPPGDGARPAGTTAYSQRVAPPPSPPSVYISSATVSGNRPRYFRVMHNVCFASDPPSLNVLTLSKALSLPLRLQHFGAPVS